VVGSFYDKLAKAPQAFTFEDLILLPGLAEIEPWQVRLETKFSVNLELKIPFAAAPMDTVSEWQVGVALALKGGIAVIHRNMPREEQLEHVRRVKEHPPLKITNVYLEANVSCQAAREYMRELGLRTVPVVDRGGKFVGYAVYGLLENCKMVAEAVKPGKAYSVEEALKARKAVLNGEVDVAAILDSKGLLIGTLTVADALEDINPALDKSGRLVVGAAISPFDVERIKMLDGVADVLVVDVAHAHNRNVIESLKKVSKELTSDLVVGNIGSGEAAKDILASIENVAGFRVGIASGSICKTGEVVGVAAPTLYAVALVRDALEELGATNIPIIADGGIKGAGDAVKALAAGAWAVMCGRLFAGTDEAPAPLVRIGDKVYKPYRGMASRGALEKRWAMDRYSRRAKKVEEGVEGLVEYRGSIYRVIDELVEALKAALGYVGAKSIPELWRKARFAKLSPRGVQEIRPHSIHI